MKVSKLTAGRLAALGAATAVAAASVLVAPSAAQAAACNGNQNYRGDINGDDVPDVAVGLPNHAGGKGAVDLHLSGGTSVLVDSSSAGVAPRAGDQFGRTVVLGDVDGDGCDDLVVGGPGAPNGGYVAVVLGGPSGVVAAGRFVIQNPGSTGADDFGASLALTRAHGAENLQTLWVGAPGTDVSGKKDAGTAYQFRLTTTGGETTRQQVGKVTTNTIGLGAGVQDDERLGEVMSLETDGDSVLIGVPRRDVGELTDAGAVVVVSPARAPGSGDNPTYDSQLITQDSSGVPDKAEAFDGFGASVAGGWREMAIGVPGEDIVKKPSKKSLRGLSKKAKKKALRKAEKAGRDVGAVQTYQYGSPSSLITRNSKANGKKIPGDRTRGDRFGTTVAYGEGLLCAGEAALAIGVPGDDVVLRKATKKTKKKKAKKAKIAVDAGSVVVIGGSNTKGCAMASLRQGDGTIPGKAERGDAFGTSLVVVFDRDNRSDREDKLIIGVPGEDEGSATDSGAITGYVDADRTGGPVTGLAYGHVLATVAQ